MTLTSLSVLRSEFSHPAYCKSRFSVFIFQLIHFMSFRDITVIWDPEFINASHACRAAALQCSLFSQASIFIEKVTDSDVSFKALKKAVTDSVHDSSNFYFDLFRQFV
ncbi:hypothetical protein BDBG_16686 [Blastomyces gilchristii SLH14081]|uniref:Uncharacterized protein n=1 Tax=Blastomyces gilchristii (strain SLH14081) TaxID=559298 RepID=A0A179UI74_BLAGS|nr:uncharacterized protein BDBG_16686 [Blastomyces gilchristii SLH14081]OAT06731.1 hypothetical protein BDBG_16686 [Blastomyces gilchristii SLH14081]